MDATPITADDIKVLKKSQSKSMRLTMLIMFPILIALLILVGVINLFVCRLLSDIAGVSMSEVVRGQFDGFDISAHYSGAYIKAQERWVIGITHFALAGFAAIMLVVRRREAKRNARILRFIEKKESSPSSR